MAYQPGGYGFTADPEKKRDLKYDEVLEKEQRKWISAVLKKPFPPGDFAEALKSGVILCQLMNTLKPGSIENISDSPMAFQQMGNISKFLAAAKAYGVSDTDLFQTPDLYESQNVPKVIMCISALGRASQRHGYVGPS